MFGILFFAINQYIEYQFNSGKLANPCEACINRTEVRCFNIAQNWEPYPINYSNITEGQAAYQVQNVS
jgi:hypothetical protein